MAVATWYWMDGDQQNGPVEPVAIAKMVASGKLGPGDTVWKEGMANWVTISKIPALMKYVPKSKAAAPTIVAPAAAKITPVVPVEEAEPIDDAEPVEEAQEEYDQSTPMEVEPAPAQVGYYNPSGSMPPRAAATLRQHARPKGDIGDWPLDDARVATFDQALKFRKRIDGAASLYRLLLLIMAIADAGGLILIASMVATARGPMTPQMMGVFSGMAFVYVAFTVLYYFAWKGTTRSQAWAPMTMGILFVLGALVYVVMLGILPNNSRSDAMPMYVSFGLMILLAGVFAYVSFRAYVAIPKYLRQPAWCQELLSKTGK